MTEFVPWPKTKRLFRDIIVTEKLDGTNAAVHIRQGSALDHEAVFDVYPLKPGEVFHKGYVWQVGAQSRNRLITPGDDNYGFARWVYDNAPALIDLLGPGTHFGEWWGRGIQRAYGLTERRFSLFNTVAHVDVDATVGGILVRPVPVLYQGAFRESAIHVALAKLGISGSVAAPGFPNPEGVCIFHTQSHNVYKVTLDANDAGKWETP
jgi:hypothetical protein